VTKKIVLKWERVDTSKLYDSLPVAIEYMYELENKYGPEAYLSEEWSSYEDMTMGICFNQLETNEEYKWRLHEEREERKKEERRLLAKKIAAEEAGTKAYGPAAALGAGASLLTGGGLEGALINRSLGVNKAAGSIVKGLAQGAFKEGTEEALQGASGQIAQNLAEQPYTGVNTFDQVPEQAGLGAAIGALSGGAGGGVGSAYDAAKGKLQANTDADKVAEEAAKLEEINALAEANKPKGPLSEAVAKGAEVAPPVQPDPIINTGPLAGEPEPEGISGDDARTVQPGSSIDIGATPEEDNVSDYTSAFDNKPSEPAQENAATQPEQASEAPLSSATEIQPQPEPVSDGIKKRMAELRELKNHGADNRTVNIGSNTYNFNAFIRESVINQHIIPMVMRYRYKIGVWIIF